VTPPDPFVPVSAPILSGLQRQGAGVTRALRPDGTADWLIVVTLDGQGFLRGADGVAHDLNPGDVMLAAPGAFQDYGHSDHGGTWVNIWVHVRPRAHWFAWLDWPDRTPGIAVIPAISLLDQIIPDLHRMVEVAHGPHRLASDASMNALERVLITLDQINPAHQRGAPDKRIARALDIIGERIGAPLDVADLARAVGLSRSQFTLLFTTGTGVSPKAYVETLRLTRAAQLLKSTAWSVGQVAFDTGFTSPFYFATRFRRQFGVTPTAYRNG
jgi:AraC family transcriptional regulator, arabinose operon regulatory protein